jgi:glycosyltransferase involved in cell wall biosynthesis
MPDPTESTSADPIAVVIPVHNLADRVGPLIAEWDEFLRGIGRDYNILVVNDGSTDETGVAAAKQAAAAPRVQILAHEKEQGFGACLRTALPAAVHPLVAYVLPDYPYAPADLGKLLDRLDQPSEVPVFDTPIKPVAASGCRTGRPAPAFWRAVGSVYRVFCRIILGATYDPAPGWLGGREHARSWAVWLTMGVPLTDVNCGLKVFRRSMFDRFPIQSDGDFAHAEIFAKLTVLTSLVAEEPLTPTDHPIPRTEWSDLWTVFRSPAFHYPLPDLSRPPAAEGPAPA